MIFFMSMVLK